MDSSISHLFGALAALTSALLWAVAAVLFGQIGREMTAKAMNLAKGLVALVCLMIFLFPAPFADLRQETFWMLALSGLLGICIGDTLYLLSIQRLGARLTLLIGTLIPVVTAIAAVFLFQEFMGVSAYLSLMLTVFGVSYVLWSKAEKTQQDIVWASGLSVAGLFVLTESSGILLTKWAVFEVDSLEATFIRQVWGVVGLTVWGLLAKELVSDFQPLKNNPVLLKKLLLTSFIGAFVGTWLSVLALKLTYASVAVALNSTSPIFILLISGLFLREKNPKSSIIGAIIAVMGVILYFVHI